MAYEIHDFNIYNNTNLKLYKLKLKTRNKDF